MRVNLAHLSPLRRGYVIGFMRARRKARVELRALAADYDAELVDLLRELGEIRDEYHTRLLTDAAFTSASRWRRERCCIKLRRVERVPVQTPTLTCPE
jgi:hypothetical protein